MKARWSEETFKGASMAAFPGLPEGMSLDEAERRVRNVLRYLADQGLLVTPGSETRTEWAWAYDVAGNRTPWNYCRDRAEAERQLAEHRERYPNDPTHLASSTVYSGPWVEVQP